MPQDHSRPQLKRWLPARLFVCMVVTILNTYAATIVSVTGTDNAEFILGGVPPQVLVASWSSASAYYDVAIAAEIDDLGAPVLISAYLTNSIGPGTTVANQIGYTAIVASTGPALLSLFTGLSLPAGTYYLTMLAPNNDLGAWLYARSPSISTAPGVLLGFEGGANEIIGAVDAAYFPASVFSQFPSPNLEFTVTGTTVPEPGTGMLAASIGLMLVASRLAVTMRSERNARK